LTKLDVQEQDDLVPEYEDVLGCRVDEEYDVLKYSVKKTCQKLHNLLGK
jgi:hypothetical protein